ncbi:hypothetical protein SDRG_03731 [Saprolegnia diclina VS20]|uniref:BZIP domain-containing protein n=1 Tax=Saprolegnia diclina (strain VS20) TaxID=1156394 RepID=T0S7P6_SAPDV|nr:hypothetical protein SDRG_03731 [Saprolegnia diclina VS20]EQC38772.1 hypothetical protein SDRG_03731 [Saprolegnia diclina VS20]|eukprot:XP_008607596.1 hypothetical protein SDRG_03731 [Saprolegnia diclina VS20]
MVATKKRPVTARRQEQCRNNQRRYREQARSLKEQLEAQVLELMRTTARLEGHVETYKQTLAWKARQGPMGRDLERCRNYWRVMASGYAAHDPNLAAHQVATIRGLFAETVAVMGTTGVEKILDQNRQYAYTFATIHMQLDTAEVMELDHGHVVRSCGSLRLGVTAETLSSVCPHVLEQPRLRARLEGRILDCPLQLTFAFAPHHPAYPSETRVTRLESSLDFTRGLVALLYDLQDVVDVMHGALIAPSGEITLAPRTYYSPDLATPHNTGPPHIYSS